MDSTEKAKLYNETLNTINDLLIEIDEKLGQSQSLEILSSIVNDYGLNTASNLIKADCEPHLMKSTFEDNIYSEGNDQAGFVSLKSILNAVEKVVNCDVNCYNDYDFKFQYFVRPETEAEMKEENHDDSVDWYAIDENADVNKLNIQFEMQYKEN